MDSAVLIQVFTNGLMLGSVYVLVALGLTIVFSIMDIVNFGHGAIFMLGGYVCYFFVSQLHLNFAAGLILSAITIFVLGLLLGGFLFKPVRGKHLPGLIVSIGMALCLQVFVMTAFGTMDKSVTSVSGLLHIFGAVVPLQRLIVIPVAAVFVVLLLIFLRYTKSGQSMMAVAQNKESASLMGINIDRTSALCFAIGSGLAAVAGSLFAPIFSLNPAIGDPMVGKAFCVIILGGLGSIPGAVLGGLVIGLVESFGGTLLTPELAPTFGYMVMFLVLVFRPRGLFGRVTT
jgi:branched-chain amino acid transport system permease protein